MNRPACIVFFGMFLLAGAQSLRAQQINPRVPPPPPSAPAGAPDASSAAPRSDTPQPIDPGVPPPPPSAPGGAPDASTAAPPSDASQPIDPTVPPPPPSEDAESDTPAAPSGPVFDPLHAGRSVDIGTFYLKKGAYDAAIDRFVEASNYQPGLATPWKLLGEAYEKKGEYAKSIESYNKYLELSPRAADAAKIRKIISEVEEKVARESPKKAER